MTLENYHFVKREKNNIFKWWNVSICHLNFGVITVITRLFPAWTLCCKAASTALQRSVSVTCAPRRAATRPTKPGPAPTSRILSQQLLTEFFLKHVKNPIQIPQKIKNKQLVTASKSSISKCHLVIGMLQNVDSFRVFSVSFWEKIQRHIQASSTFIPERFRSQDTNH